MPLNISRGKSSFYIGLISIFVLYFISLFINRFTDSLLLGAYIPTIVGAVIGIVGLIIGVRAILGKEKDTGFAIAGVAIGGYWVVSILSQVVFIGILALSGGLGA